jgi:hypothetical protein
MSQTIVWRGVLCRGVALALTANTSKSTIERSAATNFVSFFNTAYSIHQSGSAV